MEHSHSPFLHQLKHQLTHPLPGEDAWVQMAPLKRATTSLWPEQNEYSKRSAVLILLYEWENTFHLPMILRNVYDGPHSGQISLPGGRVEKTDKDLVHTALREAQEEVGVDPTKVEVIGQLSELYIPPSQFWVQPVVGIAHGRPDFVRDPSEVQAVIEAPLPDFLNEENIKLKSISMGRNTLRNVPAFEIKGHTVWGATAMMMSELSAVVNGI